VIGYQAVQLRPEVGDVISAADADALLVGEGGGVDVEEVPVVLPLEVGGQEVVG